MRVTNWPITIEGLSGNVSLGAFFVESRSYARLLTTTELFHIKRPGNDTVSLRNSCTPGVRRIYTSRRHINFFKIIEFYFAMLKQAKIGSFSIHLIDS